jgi:hypothetical protein
MTGEGRDYAAIPVPKAQPEPPDVQEAGRVPGGVLVPCTPAPGAQTSRRTSYVIKFQGVRAEITRILVKLPVWLEEKEVEETPHATTETRQSFETEAEASHAANYRVTQEEEITPQGYEQPFESKKTTSTAFAQTNKLIVEDTTAIKRSVLPTTVTVVARISGPEGPVWSQSFDVLLHPVKGEPPHTIGTGLLEQYVDLDNNIPIDAEKVYGLELLVFVPSKAASNIQIGTIGEDQEGEGEVVLFYVYETGPVNK